MDDPEAYFSRKKTYGFNIQAICDWDRKFIWEFMGHTASVQDSTAFKSSDLYRNPGKYFDPEEYVLADKAYGLERHVIMPYKEPASRLDINTAFNYQLSIPRVKIEHAFGILKARWRTIHDIPVHIDMDKDKGHKRVINWTMACVVIHNILHSMRDNEEWLGYGDNREVEIGNVLEEQESNAEGKHAGTRRREELRDLINLSL